MGATRPDGGYVFHGGCNGCTNPLRTCPDCCFMEVNWDLPDLNPAHERMAEERAVKIKQALLERGK